MWIWPSQEQVWDLGLENRKDRSHQWIWSKGSQKLDFFCVILTSAVLVHRGVCVPESMCFGMFPQVFSVNNVNVVIRTRTEHLTDEEKARIKSKSRVVFTFLLFYWKVHFLVSGERNILESLLGTVEQHISAQGVRYKIYIQLSRLNIFQSANPVGMLL